MLKTPINTKRRLFGNSESSFALTHFPIGEDGDVYMDRWILRTPWFSLRLHHILRSDADKNLHDHPMDFWTFLLTGGYTEVFEDRREWRKRWSLRRVQAETLHRIELDEPVWTVLLAWPFRRDWGFKDGPEWVEASRYFRRQENRRLLKLLGEAKASILSHPLEDPQGSLLRVSISEGAPSWGSPDQSLKPGEG